MVVEAFPAVAAVLAFVLATVVVFSARVVLVGRPAGAPTAGRWTLAAFLRAWWRWLRRADRSRSRPAGGLARVIPLDAARRARAVR